MTGFEKFVYALSGEFAESPTTFGAWHLVSLLIVITLTVLACIYLRNAQEKTVRLVLLIAWITIVVLEIYKQIVFSFNYNDGSPTWFYEWYAFPFQLCSSQLYILPFVVFLKDGKVRDACISYLMTFSFFGGLAVMIYPGDVFIEMIGINIQTMVHHGLQVIIGVYLAVRYREKLNFKFFLKGIIVFAIMCGLAILMNETLYYPLKDHTFNMFYISSHYDCSLPLLSIISPLLPWAVFLPLYVLGFCIVAYIMYIAQYGIIKLVTKNAK